MNVLIAGGTGFLGKALITELLAAGHRVTVLTRRPEGARRMLDQRALGQGPYGQGMPGQAGLDRGVGIAAWRDLPGALQGMDGVVNLAGESIGEKRWTARRKAELVDSRLATTRALVQALAQGEPRPKVLVNASAVGYYGDRAELVDEDSAPGDDFLAGLCRQWESAAADATRLGVRVVRVRTGVVLSRDGGALTRMLLPFKLFAGGPMGTGGQGFPWVHRADAVGLFRFALENDSVVGPVNAVAPETVDNAAFARALGRTMRRPCWLPVPGFALRLLLGEMADALLLSGQFVVPAAAQRCGYRWRFPELAGALADVLHPRTEGR